MKTTHRNTRKAPRKSSIRPIPSRGLMRLGFMVFRCAFFIALHYTPFFPTGYTFQVQRTRRGVWGKAAKGWTNFARKFSWYKRNTTKIEISTADVYSLPPCPSAERAGKGHSLAIPCLIFAVKHAYTKKNRRKFYFFNFPPTFFVSVFTKIGGKCIFCNFLLHFWLKR